MRKSHRVFSAAERRLAFWVIVSTVMITLAGISLDRAYGPSLGAYGFDSATVPTLPGIIDATPLS